MGYSALPLPGSLAVGGSDGKRVLNVWDQNNSFVAGQAVYVTQGGVLSLASAADGGITMGNVVGIVQTRTGSTVTVVYQGEVDFGSAALQSVEDGAASLTAGTIYYLSDQTAGSIRATKPSDPSSMIAPLMVATAQKKGIVINSLGNTTLGASIMTPVGTIVPWAGRSDAIPSPWLLCDGRAFSKTDSQYSDLYAVIGDKYKVTSITSLTAGGPNFDSVILSFTGDGHEEGVNLSIHNFEEIYNSPSGNKDFVIGWGGTNDYAVVTVTGADATSRTVTMRWKAAYPGTSPSGTALQSIQIDSPVTIRSLATNEVANSASDWYFIPDLRARTVMGVGYTVGLDEVKRGDIGGKQTHLLTTDEIPDHLNHILLATGDNGASGIKAINATAFNNATDVKSIGGSFTADNAPISMLPPYVATNWIIRRARFTGVGYETGPRGETGPAGPTGPTGECCECSQGGDASLLGMHVTPDSNVNPGWGSNLPDGVPSVFNARISLSSDYPSTWSYVLSHFTKQYITPKQLRMPNGLPQIKDNTLSLGDPVESSHAPSVGLPVSLDTPILMAGGVDPGNCGEPPAS